MEEKQNYNPCDKVKLTNPEYIYQIKYENGQITNIKKILDAATNYNQVLDEIRQKQGYLTEKEKDIVIVAAEKVLEKYYIEHIKVIEDSQKKGATLKNILNKARVGTASALVNLLDDWSEKIKSIANLESSQRQLRIWNDTYRVQKELVKKILKEENISPKVIDKVNAIYKTRSVNKAVEKGCDIFDLEKSEVLKIVKSAIRYSKLVQKD